MNILVVEDEKITRELIVDLLKNEYKVFEASNSIDAFKILLGLYKTKAKKATNKIAIKIANISTTPNYDSILRVYMLYKKVDKLENIEPQKFEKFQRK